MKKSEVEEECTFSIKITDLSRIDLPFLLLDNLKPDEEGFLPINLEEGLPWFSETKKLTLRIDVYFMGTIICLRFVHMDQLYKLDFPRVALRIANSMVQSREIAARQRNGEQRIHKTAEGYYKIEPVPTQMH